MKAMKRYYKVIFIGLVFLIVGVVVTASFINKNNNELQDNDEIHLDIFQDEDNDEEIEFNPNDLKNSLSIEFSYISTLNCSTLNNLTGINVGYIFSGNDIYQYNTTKLYSNNENCKYYDSTDSQILAYTDVEIQTKDGSYALARDGLENFYSTTYYERYFSSLGDNILYSYNNQVGNYTGLVLVDNKMQIYKVDYNNGISYYDIEYMFDDDEYVIYLNDIVKTNKAFYKVKEYKVNKEECEKYADVACIYGYELEKIDSLTRYYDYIKIAVNGYIIDLDNNLYYYYLTRL